MIVYVVWWICLVLALQRSVILTVMNIQALQIVQNLLLSE